MSSHPFPFVPGPAPMALGQFAASVAHEVDQPLAAIALHAQVALRAIERAQAPVQAQVGNALRAVLEASARASDIVRSMRSLASQGHDAPQDARSECRVDHAVDEVLDAHAAVIERLGVAVDVAIARPARRVAASPVQLHQLLRNLVANALDALADAPADRRRLRIAAALDDAGMLAITVEDTGSGLDPEQARRAFDPMFSTKPHGMGLGLAICRAIVAAHGGRIWLEATPDQGCAARFSLPCGAVRRAAPATVHHHALETCHD
ncbi:sensor histidine kinase [Massilia sp. TN1-12]|uniref:sensor histidine kinase n=1 Tax=Massilia paldalensis TaxID=3377675 RepID=UPI0038511D78